MAGMFFSISEVAAKLGKSEDEIRQLVKSGRLREFRDGPNLLFKVDEVTSLLSDTSFTGVIKPAPAAEKPAAPKSEEAEAEEILLAPDTPAKDEELQLTDADTQIVEEGIKVLGDTDSLSKEGSDETFKSSGSGPGLGSGSGSGSGTPGKEASLEEIEKDVSLDTFGSGSGLLDLSLQADDTSLGGILDEIYTPGTGGDKAAAAAAEPAAAASAAAESAEIAAEADQFPEPQAPAPALAAAMAYGEPAPDAMSNALGVMLFIPLAAVIYTAMVAVAGFSNLNPAILKMSKGFIWYIVIGMGVASLLIMVVGAVMGGEKKPKVPKPPKPPKVKKEKPPKPVKEKKGK
jgi:excisionase family DNA binding protein